MEISKQFHFDAAHQLLDHQGICKNLHGHTYLLEVFIKGDVNKKTNMIRDFHDLNTIIKENILSVLDHSYLNEIPDIDKRNPTVENIIEWIWKKLKPKLPELSKLKLQEGIGGIAYYPAN
jgi:6-pyruvoyltetrahydropterin/6-carboxytetrahydropterin synthase